jgi:hypothetical protein
MPSPPAVLHPKYSVQSVPLEAPIEASRESPVTHQTKMAPSILTSIPTNVGSMLSSTGLPSYRRVSGKQDMDNISNGPARSVASRRVSGKTTIGQSSNISNVVYSLKRRSGDELGTTTSSRLLNSTHATLLEWIRSQRMRKLPPEGSSYDKVLAWAQLFVERLHSFDLAIGNFAGDSYLAAQLAYGYCAILLEVCTIFANRLC